MPTNQKNLTTGSSYDNLRLPVSIRAYAPFYAGAALLLLFFGLLLIYLGLNIVAILFFVVGILIVPALRASDRIVFDGKRLIRTGILPRLWLRANGMRHSLKIRNIEQVDTVVVSSFRRGGRVRYLYRTSVFGNSPAMVFAGSGKRFRQMLRALLPKLDPQMLDSRSFELQHNCVEPHEAVLAGSALRIPASDVLTPLLNSRNHRKDNSVDPTNEFDLRSSHQLSVAANMLSATGSLIRAFEAYRRALFNDRGNGWLLYAFARNCSKLAVVERDDRLQRRAVAAFRLAERRANGDAELLQRIGEAYSQFGYRKRAASAYHAAIERLDSCFRAMIGLAEIALDEGKLAHVVHNFSSASRAIKSTALQKWTREEADYFSRLTEDDEYMEVEVSRMNLVEKLDRWRRMFFRVAMYSIPLIFAGTIFDEKLATDAGWLVSSIGFLLWAIAGVGIKILSARIPFEIVKSE